MLAMSDDDLVLRHHRSHAHALGTISRTSPGGHIARLDGGIHACVTPERPDRSLFNSVAYEDPDALIAAVPDLAALYEEAGVTAWTVWVPPDHVAVDGALEAAGHALDGEPQLMCAPLDEVDLDPPAPDGAPIGPVDPVAAGVVNDLAWGLPPETFGPLLARLAPPDVHWHGATGADGDVLACAAIADCGGDAYVTFVACHPDHRRRGLATASLAAGLRAARERGATTTSLEATADGRPVYRRMGFRELGPLRMRERRAP